MKNITIFVSLASENQFLLQASSQCVDIQLLFHLDFIILVVMSHQKLGKTQYVTVVLGRCEASAQYRPARI